MNWGKYLLFTHYTRFRNFYYKRRKSYLYDSKTSLFNARLAAVASNWVLCIPLAGIASILYPPIPRIPFLVIIMGSGFVLSYFLGFFSSTLEADFDEKFKKMSDTDKKKLSRISIAAGILTVILVVVNLILLSYLVYLSGRL